MVGNFCNRTACRIRNRRRCHDSNMTLRKKRTPRASQHYLGWRAEQKSLLLPVAGAFFLLTLPFIERGYPTVPAIPLVRPQASPESLAPVPVCYGNVSFLYLTRSSDKRGLGPAAPNQVRRRMALRAGDSCPAFLF